ncbi:efflux transporter outer membrane subunit [Sulfuriferula sp. AH1]|uniref:efflux transporter outer membrane subunit n=1 Tax=Sulfuriferula sp. AH1 TaxID=1985873 RepID=UPI0012F89C40|nr:efflux transporter outer membrane subunit [Sulfuriferula sp. AH1]
MTVFPRRIASGLLCIVLAGCAVSPPVNSLSAPDVPARWTEAPESSASVPQAAVAWWTVFHDRELDSLIRRAGQSSLDIRLAQARLRETRARLSVASASLQPSVNATASYARERESINAPAPVLVNSDGQIESPTGQSENLFQAGFDASWELDLFGARHRSVEAAQAEVDSSTYDRGAVALTLFAEVARNYIAFRGFQQQILVARADLAAQQDMLNLVQARYAGGLATGVDVARAAAQVKHLAAQIPALETVRKNAVHRLSVLLGKSPGTLIAELSEIRPIPVARPDLSPGLPSDLLRQRPDIRRAEYRLAAATARLGVATADMYPRFSMNGAAGLASVSAGDFFNSASLLWKIGPTITWPILRGGQIVATIKVRDAQQQQAFIAYRQAILNGLEEVENAIVTYTQEQNRRAILADAVMENQRAVDLARSRYIGGLADFRDVLDMEHILSQARNALTRSDTALAIDLVALYKSLGGGWRVAILPSAYSSSGHGLNCLAAGSKEEPKCSTSR